MVLLGPAITAAAGGAASELWSQAIFGSIMVGLVGCGIGLLITWTGFGSLLTRERLEIDRGLRRGVYHKVNILTQREEKRHEFAFDSAVQVEVIRRTERHHDSSGTGGTSEVRMCKAELRLRTPRASITIDSTSNGQDARVEHAANLVAQAIGVHLEHSGEYD